MSVLTLAGKKINWAKPPKATTRVMWSQTDMYGRKVTGSLRTIAHLDHMNTLAKKKFGRGIVVIQPSYNTTVKASAGTHDYDACLDVYIPGVGWTEQEKFFRANGAGAYHRKPPLFGHHIHYFTLPPQEGKDRADDYAVAGFKVGKFVDGGYSTAGRRTTSAQVEAYYNHRNALASNAKDGGWFPSSIKATIFNLNAYIKAQAPAAPAKPSKPVLPWFNVSFLNTHGDDGAEGTRTFEKRLPDMVKASVSGNPAFVTYCEVQSGSQIKALTKAMEAAGYLLSAYEHRLAVFHRPAVKIHGFSFAKYKTQNKGAVEGMLRVKATVNGSRMQIGVTHLDYRPGFDQGRVDQMDEGIASLKRYGALPLNVQWKKRTVICMDANSEDWVMDKSLIPAGFKDTGAGGKIDFIAVGDERAVRGTALTPASKANTDHPRLLARIGKY